MTAEYRFENSDRRIAYYRLVMERPLEGISEVPLPVSYRYVNYQPGDRDEWIRIEKSAKEFADEEAGRNAWMRYFEGKDEELKKRMFFIEDETGHKLATGTAFYDIHMPDDGKHGMLHWIAVEKEAQGKGLARPLITHVLCAMKQLGYEQVRLCTQTTTWLACRLYLDMGFRPDPENTETSRRGWEILRRLTDHPALSGFQHADDAALFARF